MINNLIDTLLLVKLSPTTDQKRLALLKDLQNADFFSNETNTVETEDAKSQAQLWINKASHRKDKIKAITLSLKEQVNFHQYGYYLIVSNILNNTFLLEKKCFFRSGDFW
jgi:hypothetical protein